MEFYQNLIPIKRIKNKLGLYMLLLFYVLLVTAQIYFNIRTEMEALNYINIVVWTLMGIIGGVQVITGKSIHNLFGKAYITINEQFIAVKSTVFKKQQIISWKELRKLQLKPTFIKVTAKTGTIITIDFKNLEYQRVQALKDVIKALIDYGKIKVE